MVQVTASLWTQAARPKLAEWDEGASVIQLSNTSAADAIQVPDAPRVQPTRAPPASNGGAVGGRAGGGRRTADSAEAILLLAEDHERIAHGLNEVVVRRLFSAGLDLQAALAIIGDHRVASKIERVLDELDLAIRDLRNTVFDRKAT
jgi:hypothetical protein